MLSQPDFNEKLLITVFTNENEKISFKNDNIIIKKDDKIIFQLSCHRLLSLWIIGNCSITSGILQKAKKYKFPVLLFNSYYKLYGMWDNNMNGNFLLRKKQYDNKNKFYAKEIVKNKILTQINQLKQIRSKDQILKDNITKLKELKSNVDLINDDLYKLLAIEGNAAKIYFKSYLSNVGFINRKPRQKLDRINLLLDIGYTHLFNYVEAILSIYGFDLYIGVYHKTFYQRKSLVCDIMECFRVIIDKAIKNMVNLKVYDEKHFTLSNKQYHLNPKYSKIYTEYFIKELISHKKDIFLYVQSFYRNFMKNNNQYYVFNYL